MRKFVNKVASGYRETASLFIRDWKRTKTLFGKAMITPMVLVMVPLAMVLIPFYILTDNWESNGKIQ